MDKTVKSRDEESIMNSLRVGESKAESQKPPSSKAKVPEKTKPQVEIPISPKVEEQVKEPLNTVVEPHEEVQKDIEEIKIEPQVISSDINEDKKNKEFDPALLENMVSENT